MQLLIILIVGFSYLWAETCQDGRHWVRAHHRHAYYRYNGTFVKAADVIAHCRDNPKGYGAWSKYIKSGKPKIWSQIEKLKTWNEEERERVLEAISDLPYFLRKQKIEGLYRMVKSETEENPSSIYKNSIALYDLAFELKSNLARVIAHELTHSYYSTLLDKQKNEYEKIAGWDWLKIDDRHSVRKTRPIENFVELSGMKSPEEDFVKNFEYFIFEPKKLETITPTVYKWLRKNFGAKLLEQEKKQ